MWIARSSSLGSSTQARDGTLRKRFEERAKLQLQPLLPSLRAYWDEAVADDDGLTVSSLMQLYQKVLPELLAKEAEQLAAISGDQVGPPKRQSTVATIDSGKSRSRQISGTTCSFEDDDSLDCEERPRGRNRQVTQTEVRLLAGLTDANSDGLIHKGGFFQGVMLWNLVRGQKQEWRRRINNNSSEPLESLIQELQTELDELDQELQAGDQYYNLKQETEAVIELASKVSRSKNDWHEATMLALGYWVLHQAPPATEGLIREKLKQRLRLEDQLYWGCTRFVTLGLMFVLSVMALDSAGKSEASRGIRINLINRLSLEDVDSVSTVNEAYEYLKVLSSAAQKFAPLSASYFDDGAELRLLGDLRTLSQPLTLPETNLWVGEAFTLQAWVGLSRGVALPPSGLPLFRRALKAAGTGSELSCLSWNFPPSLAYGAHDFGGADPSHHGDFQENVAAEYPKGVDLSSTIAAPEYREYEQMVLHSLVVNGTTARFYVDDRVWYKVELPRIVTNCKSEITTLGAKGLTLANVNYYARALTSNEIQEVYKLGGLLGNLGYMVQPRTIHDLTEVDQLSIEGAINARISQEATQEQTAKYEAVAALSTAAILFKNAEAGSGRVEPVITPVVGPDQALGEQAMEIVRGPVRVSPDIGAGVLNESVGAFPRFGRGRAITISTWVKQDSLLSEGYIVTRAIPHCTGADQCELSGYDNLCWYFYAYPQRIEFRYPHPTNGWSSPATSVLFHSNLSGSEQFRGDAFRHVAVVVDPSRAGSQVELYIDGQNAQVGLAPGEVVADCEDSIYLRQKEGQFFNESLSRSEVWIGGRPPGAWLLTSTQMANLRVFDRALSGDDVQKLFKGDEDPEHARKTIKEVRGCTPAKDIKDDQLWTDEYGNNCLWYYDTRVKGLTNCKVHAGARSRCQVACYSAEACYKTSAPDAVSMQIWRQQVEIRSKSSWGTMCIAKSTTAAKEAIKCGMNAVIDVDECRNASRQKCESVVCSAFENDRSKLEECLGDVAWTSKNGKGWQFLPCIAILEAEEPACAWDDTGLEEVARASRMNEAWSMQFWYEVFDEDSCAPGIRLIGGDGATFSRVHPQTNEASLPPLDPPGGRGCEKESGVHHFPYGPWEAGCPTLPEAANLLYGGLLPGEKHLLVFGRTSGDGDACPAGKAGWGLHMDAVGDVDCVAKADLPEIPPSTDFLRVIGVMGNLRMSPITFLAGYPSVSYMADTLASGVKHQQLRQGPDPIQQDQFSKMQRQVKRFKETTFLVAPPMVLQSRRTGSDCAWKFSEEVVATIVRSGRQVRCQGLYSCDTFSQDSLYQCPGDIDESDALWFGGSPREVDGAKQYVELLQTITDFPVVVRPRSIIDTTPEVKQTSEFLDDLTQTAKVECVFFSPRSGLSTVLTVSFTNGVLGLDGEFHIRHYIALTGREKQNFRLLEALSMVAQIMLVVQLIADVRYALRQRKRLESVDGYTVFVACLDAVVFVATSISSVLMLISVERSETKTEYIIAQFVEQDWGSNEMDPDGKISAMIDNYSELNELVTWRENVDLFAMFQILLIFVAWIMSTHLHPRVAALTSTLMYTLSEMCHFLMIFALVLMAFAAIGTWRFGPYRDDMSTFAATLYTQVDAVLGPPGTLKLSDREGENDLDYIVYVFLLHSFNFFFLVNFFLAIIVGGYAKFAEGFENTDVEYDIITDCWITIKKMPYQWRHRWANPRRIAHLVEELPSVFVSVQQLTEMGLFKDRRSAEAFNDFYRRLTPLVTPSYNQSALVHEVNKMDSGFHARLHHFEHKQHTANCSLRKKLVEQSDKQDDQAQKLEEQSQMIREMRATLAGVRDAVHGSRVQPGE